MLNIIDALLTHNGRKTLSALHRLLVQAPGAKAAADFFRESPWKVEAISEPRKRFMLQKMLEIAHHLKLDRVIYAHIDDGMGKKGKATRHLETEAKAQHS